MAISIVHLQLTDVIEKLYEIEKFFYDATMWDTLVSLPFYLARSVSRSWPGLAWNSCSKTRQQQHVTTFYVYFEERSNNCICGEFRHVCHATRHTHTLLRHEKILCLTRIYYFHLPQRQNATFNVLLHLK